MGVGGSNSGGFGNPQHLCQENLRQYTWFWDAPRIKPTYVLRVCTSMLEDPFFRRHLSNLGGGNLGGG